MTENSIDAQAPQYDAAETGELAHLYRGEMSPALISHGAFTDAFAFSGTAVILRHLRESQKGSSGAGWRRRNGDQAGLPIGQ